MCIYPGTNSDCTFVKQRKEKQRLWANASENPDKTKNCYTCPSGTYATGPFRWLEMYTMW